MIWQFGSIAIEKLRCFAVLAPFAVSMIKIKYDKDIVVFRKDNF